MTQIGENIYNPPNLEACSTAVDPCDITSLTITNSKDKQTVSCTVKARSDKSLSRKEMVLLGQYDLLLECMADFENNWGAKPSKVAEIKVDAKRSPAGSCKINDQHPAILFSALRNGDANDELPSGLTKGTHEIKDLLAPSQHRSSGRGQGWLAQFWNFNENEKLISVAVSTCGIVEKGRANGTLKGLIKIYPIQTWKLSLKIPAFAEIKKSRGASIDLRGTKKTSQSSSRSTGWGSSGSSSSSSTEVNIGDGTHLQNESLSYTNDRVTETLATTEGTKKNEAYIKEEESAIYGSSNFLGGTTESLQYSEATDENAELQSSQAFTVKPALTLTVNGQSLAVTDRINNIIYIAQTIRDTWNELQNWAPKIGWSASLHIALLEGEISGEWGYRASQELSGARICRVEPYYRISAQVMLVKCVTIVSFGVEFGVENWFNGRNLVEIVVKLQGTVSLELPFKAEMTSGNHSQKPAALSAKSKAEIKAVGRAMLLDYTHEASVSIDGGFAIDAEFKCGFKQDPVFDAKLYSLPVMVYIVLSRPHKDPYSKEIECLPKKDVWSGQFPKPATP
ncbi:MAG: hypothetical protein GY928_08035 [Colwellia sp.]|nr:hypothetical protein [Colwellia sp.]